MSAANQSLDTRRSIETPEGVEIVLHLAGPFPRALAYGIDVLVRTSILVAGAVVFGLLGEMGQGLIALMVFFGEWFYPVFFEVLAGGATPGKRWMKLQVLHEDGTPVGWSASILRNLLRFADFLPAGFGSGLLCSMFHPEFKRIGDIAAGTVVVHRELDLGIASVPRAQSARPAYRLTQEEQHAILQFAERFDPLGPDRAAELADHAWALTGRRGSEGVGALIHLANWLLGRR